ncbi:MAG TPA: SUMF1/EgtB/PvdO family nonheme iron enzyme [Pyrinomonadaceae bacterium]|nr:SUMF1/EgtB/PvdO family nonheme iron enzyme [Pyrinomonadaceae bacterium]
MTEKTAQSLETLPVSQPGEDSRVLPLAVAGFVCFTVAVILGTGSWMLFGSHARTKTNQESIAEVQTYNPNSAETSANIQIKNSANVENIVNANANTNANVNPNPEPAVNFASQGLVKIEGGEIALGGGETKLPIERAVVGDFWMSETEVTNAQYAEFVKDANHPAPSDWKKGEIPAGRENFPVTNVSWEDANAFCNWKEKKVGFPVRLPTEAEWEFAARGRGDVKYPWGNDWNDEAAASKEKGGKVSEVKSHSLNRSQFGIYDLVGNVWEWLNNDLNKDSAVSNEEAKKALEEGKKLRIVKGGSVGDLKKELSVRLRFEIPEETKDSLIGFRYVIIQKK